MRKEWRDVETVLIDEISMASLQLLADVDYGLRDAKECLSKYFGGVVVVFAGDLCQFPPVHGSPVYADVSDTKCTLSEKELRKRLGYLAWHSITDVIELTEQKRMKDDVQYAEAILRLRKRKSTRADVALLNTRVMKSSSNPDGVSIQNENDTVVIVNTNYERRTLNMAKAQANARNDTNIDLHVIEAVDYNCNTKEIIKNEAPLYARDELLDRDFESTQNGVKIPAGKVPLYEGMSVVLKDKNISTEMGLTNGAVGTVYKICLQGGPRKIAKVVLVQFEGCKAKLSGLLAGVVPIKPTETMFTTQLVGYAGGKGEAVTVKRVQIALQPAFAVTGHFAQGRTMAHVTTGAVGGCSGYVTLSRAKTRQGLALTSPVTLDSILKSPLPDCLQ